jgi:hypothetical protein
VARILSSINKLPFIGRLCCYIVYVFVLILTPIIMWGAGGRGIRFGTSVIWVPKNKQRAILDGIECLRTHDPEMFLRLGNQRLNIVYAGNIRTANAGGIFYGIHERRPLQNSFERML